MADVQLTANYRLSEFEAVSSRPLTLTETDRAARFAREVLQPVRRAMAFPIKITSFVRHGDDGTHQDGQAIDIQPCRSCGGSVTLPAGEFVDRLERMFQWLATFQPKNFGTLIHERNHLHVTLPGVQARIGVVYREPEEGRYELASLAPLVGASLAVPIAIGLLLWSRHRA